MSFGTELRRRRLDAGLSLADLARLVHYSKSHLSKIENGVKPPSVDLARRCDTALNGAGELAGLVSTQEHLTEALTIALPSEEWVMTLAADGQSEFGAVRRREVLAAGAATLVGWAVSPTPAPKRDDPATVASFRAMYDEVCRIGQVAAPATLIPMLVAQTHALRVLALGAQPGTRAALLLLAARFAEYTGWMAQESGNDEWALWWTDRAVELAQAGGDDELAAYALVRRALVAMYRHDATGTVELARHAERTARNPRIRGLAAQREAQGYALAGDADACQRALDRAGTLLREATSGASTDDGRPTLGTTSVVDPAAMAAGWCLYDLGRSRPAARLLEEQLRAVPMHAHRTRARFGARYALALASAGELDHACAVTGPLLDAVARVDSATVRTDLRQLARTLNRWHTHPAVREVMPGLTAALHTTIGRP
jgi:transcriptional regulator with XRE-family HTH domain